MSEGHDAEQQRSRYGFRLVPKVPSPPLKLPGYLDQRIKVDDTNYVSLTGHWLQKSSECFSCTDCSPASFLQVLTPLLVHPTRNIFPYTCFTPLLSELEMKFVLLYLLHLVWCADNTQTWINHPCPPQSSLLAKLTKSFPVDVIHGNLVRAERLRKLWPFSDHSFSNCKLKCLCFPFFATRIQLA